MFLAHEALALVQSLNLPEARFFDAVLLDHDQSEIREPFKIFVPGASKKSVLDTQSPAFKDGMSGSFHSYVLASALTNDDDIVLNADALAGPEIWFERRVRKALFLSERIAQALEQNGLTEAFALRRAPVMPGS